MDSLLKKLVNIGFSLCSIYMLDITFINEKDKFISGILMALSAMIVLGILIIIKINFRIASFNCFKQM